MSDTERGTRTLSEILSETGIKPKSDDACLDVGCGFGNLLVAMQSKFSHVFGVELDSENVTWCRKRCAAAEVHCGSAEHLPWADNSFTLVTSTDVFEHIDYAKQVTVANEIARVIRSGGWAVISVPNRYQLYDEHNFFWMGTWLPDGLRKAVTKALHRIGLAADYTKTYEQSRRGWSRLFRNAGFEVKARRVGSRRFITANRYNLLCRMPPNGKTPAK